MDFPLTKKTGLKITAWPARDGIDYTVDVRELESFFEKATVVYGFEGLWSVEKDKGDTRQALLICVEELPKEPLKVEFEAPVDGSYLSLKLVNTVDDLKKSKTKNVRVIIEEIKE